MVPSHAGVARPVLVENALAAFFTFLPFAYALQVLTQRSYAPVLGYLFLVGTMVWLLRRSLDGVRVRGLDTLSVGFLALIFHHCVMSWVVAVPGDIGLVVRVLVLFTVPLGLFWMPRAISLDGLELVLRCIAIAALLVSIELVYENVSTQIFKTSTHFQLLNKSYLHDVLGLGELAQLWWPAYRAAGLIEHPHATALFCNIGLCIAAMFYVFKNRKFYLAIALISAFAVWTQGFRVPVLSQIAVLAVLGGGVCLGWNRVFRGRAAICVSLYALTVILILVVDPTYVVHRYYWPSAQGNFQLPDNIGLGKWISYTSEDLIRQSYLIKWLQGDSSSWLQALFGHGLVGTLSGRFPFSDDMFLLALPLQYGLLGSIVFGGVWIAAIWSGVDCQLTHRNLQVPVQLKMIALISLATLLLLALSMTHSGILQRKVIYPLFPFFIGVVACSRKAYQELWLRSCALPVSSPSVRTALT
jgi:hypothetical protein